MHIITAHSDDWLLYWQGGITKSWFYNLSNARPRLGNPYWTTIRECSTLFTTLGSAVDTLDSLIKYYATYRPGYGLSLHNIEAREDVERSVPLGNTTTREAEPVLHLERPIDLG